MQVVGVAGDRAGIRGYELVVIAVGAVVGGVAEGVLAALPHVHVAAGEVVPARALVEGPTDQVARAVDFIFGARHEIGVAADCVGDAEHRVLSAGN